MSTCHGVDMPTFALRMTLRGSNGATEEAQAAAVGINLRNNDRAAAMGPGDGKLSGAGKRAMGVMGADVHGDGTANEPEPAGKSDVDHEFLALERELAVFLRRARANSGEMAREVHPELEAKPPTDFSYGWRRPVISAPPISPSISASARRR